MERERHCRFFKKSLVFVASVSGVSGEKGKDGSEKSKWNLDGSEKCKISSPLAPKEGLILSHLKSPLP